MIPPDSSLLPIIAGALTLGSISVAIWARIRRHKIRSVLAVVLSSILAVGVVGAHLNSVNHFYPTWSDVFGGATAKEYAHNTPLPLPPRTDFSADDPDYQATFSPITDPETLGDSPQGEYLSTEFRGPVSDFTQTVRVWAPTGWEKMSDLHVLFFLHGYPSAPQRAPQQLDIGHTMSTLIADGTIPPTIVVFPTTLVAGSEPTCVDVSDAPAVGTWTAREVPALIAANFPVSAAAASWTLAGFSFGGYCAGVLGAQAQDTFHQVLLFGGFDTPIYAPLSNPQFAPDYRVSTQFSQAHPFRIYAPIIAKDADTQALATALHEIATDGDVLVTPVDTNGSHNWSTIRSELLTALQWHGDPPNSASSYPDSSRSPHSVAPSLVAMCAGLAVLSGLAIFALVIGWRSEARRRQLSAVAGIIIIPVCAAAWALLGGAIALGVVNSAADLPALANLFGIN